MPYTMTTHLAAPPEVAEKAVRAALADEGFGVLTEIDVQATFQAKLGIDIGSYRILGACNPSLAHAAIGADPDIGALLPCNVVLRAGDGGGTDVVIADPDAMMSVAGPTLVPIATDAKQRLTRVLAAVAGTA